AQPGGRQQQPEEEAVAETLLLLLALRAVVLAGVPLAPAAVGRAEGVLQAGTLVAAVRLVEEGEPGALGGFVEHPVAEDGLQPVLGQARWPVAQEAQDVA